MLVAADGTLPNLLLQAVPEPQATKNRMHLDIESADTQTEAIRLEGLGARRVEAGVRREHATTWVIMTDLEDNEFASVTAAPADPVDKPSRKP